MPESQGVGQVISDALAAASAATPEWISKGAQLAVGGLLAVLSVIPGVGGMMEGAAAGLSGSGGSMDAHYSHNNAPAIAPVTPAIAQSIEPAVEKAPSKIFLPPEAFAAVEAMRNNATTTFAMTSPDVAITLGTGAQSGINFGGMGPQSVGRA